MGKFFDKFKEVGGKIDNKANKFANNRNNNNRSLNPNLRKNRNKEKIDEKIYYETEEDLNDSDLDSDDYEDHLLNDSDKYDIGVQPAQKPESFHHFILENQYKDLEKSIRGFKDVFNKTNQKWETKRKEKHCFTDEEAEDILRTAQSHLSTDIKLSFINKEVFGEMMMAIYKQIDNLLYSISEYRYGRYKDTEEQYNMKLQNRKIFLELWTRIQANYSRAIQGAENKATHGSVQGQESLQQTDRFSDRRLGEQY